MTRILISDGARKLKGNSFFIGEDADYLMSYMKPNDITEIYYNIWGGRQGDTIVLATWREWQDAFNGEEVPCVNAEDITKSWVEGYEKD